MRVLCGEGGTRQGQEAQSRRVTPFGKRLLPIAAPRARPGEHLRFLACPGSSPSGRRRALASIAVLGLGVGLWVALADGTAGEDQTAARTDAGELSARRLAGERLVTGFEGRQAPRAVKRMIREGRVAGVILFSDNLGGHDHARGLIRSIQAIRRPRGLRDPLLVMIDQEGGLVKRLSGPPEASAQAMGRRGGRYSRRQGVLHGPQPEAGGRERQPGAGARRGSARQRDPCPAPQLRRQATPRDPHGGPVRERDAEPGVAAAGKHFPGLGAAGESTDLAVQRIRLKRSELEAGRRAPLPLLHRTRSRHGDDLDRDLHALFAQAGGLLEEDRDRGAASPAGVHRLFLDHRRARDGVRPQLRRAGQGGYRRRQGRHRPAPVHGPPGGRSRGARDPPRAALGKAGARAVRGLGSARAGPASRPVLAERTKGRTR